MNIELCNKGGWRLPSHKQMFLLFRSQHASAQTGHHQVIREECANDGLHVKAAMLLYIS
jgi:hypothetical protein